MTIKFGTISHGTLRTEDRAYGRRKFREAESAVAAERKPAANLLRRLTSRI